MQALTPVRPAAGEFASVCLKQPGEFDAGRSLTSLHHMVNMRPKSLGEPLEQSDQSNSLISHANFILDLRKVLAEVLPGDLARHCSIANYKSGRLVVFADNNAIAAKLKLLATGLPKKISGQLKQTGRQVTAVAIEVQPRPSPPAIPAKTISLSATGAKAIAALSVQVTDSKLKHILASLASRGQE